MGKEILISATLREKRVAIMKDGRLDEFYIERPQDKTIVGNIYKGKIEAVVPSIAAAFVDIGLPKKGFLYLSEIEELFEGVKFEGKKREVKKGEEVLVQVVKESFGTKGPRISCGIGIAGRYLVLMPDDQQIGVSRRIEDEEERRRLRQILQEVKLPEKAGFIVRTAAAGKTKNELQRDAQFLLKLWQRVEKTIKRKKAPSLVYEEYDLVLRVIRDSFTEDISRVVVDSKGEYYRVQRFMKAFMGNLARRIEFYRGDDLFDDLGVEPQITRIFESKVYFKSKAYIIIEPTEGLVVIDVNSGGFKEKIKQEEAAFKINCEAAEEVAHQLRLRDLGGIIVIDFIDMERESHRRELLQVLKKALSTDRAKYDILGISKFGLIEMTRERVHNTVLSLSFQMCPYCSGKGKVKTPVTMSIQVLKELRRFLKGKKLNEITVTLNPDVSGELAADRDSLRNFERRHRIRVNIVSNPALKIEDITIA